MRRSDPQRRITNSILPTLVANIFLSLSCDFAGSCDQRVLTSRRTLRIQKLLKDQVRGIQNR